MKKQARTLSSYLGQRYAATVNVDQVEIRSGCGTPGIFPRRTGCSKFNGAYVFQADYYESNKEREGLCQRNDSVRRNLEKGKKCSISMYIVTARRQVRRLQASKGDKPLKGRETMLVSTLTVIPALFCLTPAPRPRFFSAVVEKRLERGGMRKTIAAVARASERGYD
ncbi:hypothetical protein V1477_007222 [Vespula maculifrons]|uniref:Uncharacterized protein n=1 Tax=Vespula maculifrons TaxID=7453 RepID=A0ABD2CHX7_VESMC